MNIHKARAPALSRELQLDAAASRRRPSLKLLLSVVMVSLVTAVAASLVTIAYFRARNTALENVEQRMVDFSDRLANRLLILSDDTTMLVSMVAGTANSFLAPPSERLNDKISALREALLRSPDIDGVYAGYPDGSFFHAVDLENQAWRNLLKAPAKAAFAIRSIERHQLGAGLLQVFFFDADGHQLSSTPSVPSAYDPRARAWYRMASGGKEPVSTGPYQMASTGALGMTISRAHRGNRGIVIGADVILTRITDFITAERLTQSSVDFIADSQGRLLVHSDRATMAQILAGLTERDFSSVKAPDPLTEHLKNYSGEDGHATSVMVGDRQYLVMATTIRDALLFQHDRIFIAAPYDELMAPARRAFQQGLLIAAAVVALGVACAVVLAGLITKSLQQLTRSANRLQDLDFQTQTVVSSNVSEIATLSRAMNHARDAILTFALYVPRELVRTGIRSGEFSHRFAKRQDVTALFTDIYDFTTISERHSPEEVVAMLSDYFDILNQVVSAHNGTILQFLGDSIFAIWNAPLQDEFHTEKACRSALAMQSALDSFNAAQREKGLPAFATRFGIHAGVAVVGSVGASDRLQYTAMGDTINVASRLEGMNKIYGTTILASAEVQARCHDRIKFHALGEGKVKGRAVGIDLYEVVGVVEQAPIIEPIPIAERPV